MTCKSHNSAFSLMEVLIAVGVIAVLGTTVAVIIDPTQLLAESRDSQRISEASKLSKLVDMYASLSDGSSLGIANVSYVSIPDPAATTAAGNQCQSLGLPQLPIDWTYHCAGPDFYRNIDGTGWLPVDFASLPSGASISDIFIDPRNTTSTGLYYTYATNGYPTYVFTAAMESKKYGKGGSKDVTSKDGGQYDDLFEAGFNLALAPIDHSNNDEEDEELQAQSNYSFGVGFLPPIEPGGAGVYELGRTLPIKFRLTDQTGGYTTVPTARLFVTKIQNGIVGTTPVVLDDSENDGGGLFRAHSNQYSYNLDTDDLGIGTWQLKAVLSDGNSYTDIISLED